MTARALSMALLILLITGATPVFAQSIEISDQLAKKLGAGYAALINFAENPDIGTATYYIREDNAKDPSLHVTRLNGEHRFELKDRSWEPFIQIHAPYETLKAEYEIGTVGNINTQWKALGAALTAGIRIPVTTNLTIIPSLSGGYVRLENNADYYGDAGLLEPIFEGVLFDWSSDAWLAGASLTMEYERKYNAFDLNLRTGASHNLIETFYTSRGSVEFSSYSTTLFLHGETVHPTPFKPLGYPLSLVPMLGCTSFAGPYRNELGFNYFVEGGFALETDISRNNWIIKKVRLGGKGIYGESVYGWSAIFSWKF